MESWTSKGLCEGCANKNWKGVRGRARGEEGTDLWWSQGSWSERDNYSSINWPGNGKAIMWMNGDSKSNLSAWLVWVSNFNSSLSSSKWFFFHRHIGMWFTFQTLLMLSWVSEEKKEDFCMNISHAFLQQCPVALLKLCAHSVICSQFRCIAGFAGKDSLPRKFWNSKDTAQEQNISSLFFCGYCLFVFLIEVNKSWFKAFVLQT